MGMLNTEHVENPSKIKNSNLTRWNSTLIMLESFNNNTSSITFMLEKLKKYELILSSSEIGLIKDLVKVFSIFKEASIQLQGSKYPTVNLNLLFLEDIKDR